MWMGAPVFQKCLLPVVFRRLPKHTPHFSFLSWLSCQTRVSQSFFSQMRSTSLHIKHQNLPMKPGQRSVAGQESTSHRRLHPPKQKKAPKNRSSHGWSTRCSTNENCELFEASSTHFFPPLPKNRIEKFQKAKFSNFKLTPTLQWCKRKHRTFD